MAQILADVTAAGGITIIGGGDSVSRKPFMLLLLLFLLIVLLLLLFLHFKFFFYIYNNMAATPLLNKKSVYLTGRRGIRQLSPTPYIMLSLIRRYNPFTLCCNVL